MTLHRRRLATYLNDHLAVATGGVELARRALASNTGTEYEPVLRRASVELEDDLRLLRAAMAALDVRVDRVKPALAWAGEKLGRLKPNDSLTSYSPLSRVIELEGLMVVSGLLRTTFATLEELAPEASGDAAAARDRAQQRVRDLEGIRAAVMRDALTA